MFLNKNGMAESKRQALMTMFGLLDSHYEIIVKYRTEIQFLVCRDCVHMLFYMVFFSSVGFLFFLSDNLISSHSWKLKANNLLTKATSLFTVN